jgi:CDP-glucose 4,6-dehydratase
MKLFSNSFSGKRVLITGHTGFKGSWLTTWLLKLGATVIGASKDIPTNPSMFADLKLCRNIKHHMIDVCDLNQIKALIHAEQPEYIFHLAAQAIVSTSYENPVETINTNVIGTCNLLESLRNIDWRCNAVFITSDKCYDNVEWVFGYKETDSLGGKDIYSGSKGAAELIIKSYYNTFFKSSNSLARIGSVRAGNVIGGGDWSKDRIIVDCIRSWRNQKRVSIRCPDATRPWQHVLEPLSGYLWFASKLSEQEQLNGESFNFGPRSDQNRSVINLLSDLAIKWGFDDINKAYCVTDNIKFNEATLLKLNCDKSYHYLKWEPNLDYKEMIELINEWYKGFLSQNEDLLQLTNNQIEYYENKASSKYLIWAR